MGGNQFNVASLKDNLSNAQNSAESKDLFHCCYIFFFIFEHDFAKTPPPPATTIDIDIGIYD